MIDDKAAWRQCEVAWAIWLTDSGYTTVTHLGNAVANTQRSQAPLMTVGGRHVRAPDISSVRQGHLEYWEVKYRSRPFVDRETGELEHWMPYDALSDYLKISEAGSHVHVVLFEGPTATAAGRWLLADVEALVDGGRRAKHHAHDGTAVDAWIWRRSVMKAISGPELTLSVHEPPVLEVEGEGRPLAPDELATAEQSLRARRRTYSATTKDSPEVPHEAVIQEDHAVGLDVIRRRLNLPALPQYSVWISGITKSQIEDAIALIDYGIRVFVVLRAYDDRLLGTTTAALRSAGLLQVCVLPDAPQYNVVDGANSEDFSVPLAAVDVAGGINVEQYRVVHAPFDADIAVLAGAGTGKTETMAERVMFLLSCVRFDPATARASMLQLNELALVTFTREAANELRGRLARTLMLRRRLCKSSIHPTLPWLLQLSSTQISTIHAFARSMLATHGAGVGVAPNFSITNRTMEFRDLLASVFSEPLEDLAAGRQRAKVPSPHEWYRHVIAVFEHLESNGLNPNQLDWGPAPRDPLVAEIQELTKEGVRELARHSVSAAHEEQALRLNDLVPAASRALAHATPAKLRYVFVDEFQDTDLTQIGLFSRLRCVAGCRTFIVGDVKQGIYRFRGASGDAFEAFEEHLTSAGLAPTLRFTLTRNFRSIPDVLDRLHGFFTSWGTASLLAYTSNDRLRAGLPGEAGGVEVRAVRSRSLFAREAAAAVAAWRTAAPNDSIGIICRRNSEAIAIQREVRMLGLECDVAVGGSFFLSRPVRELLILLSAIANPKDGSLTAQLLETRWVAGLMAARPPFRIGHISVGPWSEFASTITSWHDRLAGLDAAGRFPRADLSELARRLSELRVACEHISPLQFVVECIREFDPSACSLAGQDDDAARSRYSRNLDHLLALLDATFPAGGGSIWLVIDWLTTSIAVNRLEDEPIERAAAAGTTLALSAHKAKGLEFDRVLIPRTWVTFGPPRSVKTEVIVAPETKRIGWIWHTNEAQFSTVDQVLQQRESSAVAREEARLLYVAMTRARRHLSVFVASNRPPTGAASPAAASWEQLILGRTI